MSACDDEATCNAYSYNANNQACEIWTNYIIKAVDDGSSWLCFLRADQILNEA